MKLLWKLGYKTDPGADKMKWTGAKIPGAIQLDIAAAEGYADYRYGDNWRDYLWMEDSQFTYRTEFKKPPLKTGERLFFFSAGIEYAFEISINHHTLLKQEGMFTRVELDVSDYLQDTNMLEIQIFPVPKAHPLPADRTQAAQSVKPAVGYGWDWHPRLIPLGIWNDTGLVICHAERVSDARISYRLTDDFRRADINAQVTGSNLRGKKVMWKISDSNGRSLKEKLQTAESDVLTMEVTLDDPQLWWPHDHGVPYLYQSEIFMENDPSSPIKSRIGFRRIRLVMNEGAWDEPQQFPKSRSVAPAQLEINGRKIFLKGSNWVHPEIFPGSITEKRTGELTDRAVEANFNILRIWGGGIVNKDSFYRQCDEKGLLVWQEFPLACNNYEDSDHYLAILEQEARSIIWRVSQHPSLALWSGGNELFNAWSGMTDQSLALRLLNSLCLELDPQTPFIATSPLEGMGHGYYAFREMDTGEEVFEIMNRSKCTAYTEFGIPSPSFVEVIRQAIPEEELWPPKPGGSWESHHGFNAWLGDTWLMQELIEDYFGPSENLESLVRNGQILQSEGLKAIYEAARRQKPYCSMAINWCFNEPWPAAAGTSIINYPNLPKPAFSDVKQACRPVLGSAAIRKMTWREGELFESDIWLLNDHHEMVEPGTMIISIKAGNKTIELLRWDFPAASPNKNIPGPIVRFILPAWDRDNFTLKIDVSGKPGLGSEYFLCYQKNEDTVEKTPTLNA